MTEYERFTEECRACQQCALATTRTKVVVGVGPVPCELMLIGEAPGEQEDLQGEPFVGKAGQLLDKILAAGALSRDKNIYIANTIKCRPPANRNPKEEELVACAPWLERQLELVAPKIVIFCGSVAMRMAFPEEKTGITKQRGQWKTWRGRDAITIFHPSYLLRNQSRAPGSPKWLTWQDVKAIRHAWEFYQAVS